MLSASLTHQKPLFKWHYFLFLMWRLQTSWERKVNKSERSVLSTIGKYVCDTSRADHGSGSVFPLDKSLEVISAVNQTDWGKKEKKIKTLILRLKNSLIQSGIYLSAHLGQAGIMTGNCSPKAHFIHLMCYLFCIYFLSLK